ncbi:hypothetical protein CHARACLAT_012673 [Characodon lateralis]|uniref:Secreted protein n=1 Tax=Characodon lateralis TaxID=208331 RepID=A0ABU7F3S6_9TELE|nr:hypothetical protein [Characodon lateralis]
MWLSHMFSRLLLPNSFTCSFLSSLWVLLPLMDFISICVIDQNTRSLPSLSFFIHEAQEAVHSPSTKSVHGHLDSQFCAHLCLCHLCGRKGVDADTDLRAV